MRFIWIRQNVVNYGFLTSMIITLLIAATIFVSCTRQKKVYMADQRFIQLENELAEKTDINEKQKRIDVFIQSLNSENYPIFENDSTVVLLFQTAEENAFILGDMAESSFLPMQRIAYTNLFYLRASYEPGARLEYWLSPNPDSIFGIDPLNHFIVYNGFGPMSELAMPRYKRHAYFNDFLFGRKGDLKLVKAMEIPAGILDYAHQLHIYLPPDYKEDGHNYPVVYIKDGLDYLKFAQSAYIINLLIRENKIEPIIAVFITPPNRHLPDAPNRATEYGLNDAYVSFICDELVPFIDERFKTQKSPSKRLVVGDSYGGLISDYIPFSRPDIFQMGYSQSGYLSFQNDRLIKLFADSPEKDIRLYVDVGTYERNVGGAFLPAGERDFLLANRRFKEVLEMKNYDFVYHEYFEGHTWGNWRRHLIDGLIHFFADRNK